MQIFDLNQFRCLMVLSALVSSSLCFAANDIRTQRVQFPKGSNSTVITSSIRGYEIVDYVVRAQAGQYLNTSLATRHGATYFNILLPHENESAMFIGSTRGKQFEGTLPQTGDYKIRVYMMRSAARRNEVANYRLEIIIASPRGSIDKKVPGTSYHATGKIRCSMYRHQSMGNCNFGVKREGYGNATVSITRPDGMKRQIFFKHGNAIGYDQSQADPARFRAEKNSDLNIIYIGHEKYEIPDAVVSGG